MDGDGHAPTFDAYSPTLDAYGVSNISNNGSMDDGMWSEGFANPLTGHLYLQVIFTACYVIVFSACFFGNLAVLVVILRNQAMRTRTNFFLANLAVADVCVSIFCIFPNMAIFYSPFWLLGRAMCKLYYFMNQMSYTTSITLLTVISLERYIAIMHPLKAQGLITITRLKLSLCCVWILTAIYNSPQFVIFDLTEFDHGNGTRIKFCYYTHSTNINMRVYHLCNFVIFYVTPLLLMSFVYLRISLVLWRSSAGTVEYTPSRESYQSRAYSYSVTSAAMAEDHKLNSVIDKRGHIKLVFGAKRNRPKPTRNSVKFDYASETTECGSISSFDKERPENNESFELTRMNTNFSHQYGSSRNTTPVHYNSRTNTPVHFHNSNNANNANNVASNASNRHCQPNVTSSPYALRSNRTQQTTTSPKVEKEKVCKQSAMVARRKVIRLLVAVVVSFAVCVLPYHVLILLENLTPQNIPPVYPPISYLILYLNSGLNPILYALLSDKFRRSLRDILRCRKS